MGQRKPLSPQFANKSDESARPERALSRFCSWTSSIGRGLDPISCVFFRDARQSRILDLDAQQSSASVKDDRHQRVEGEPERQWHQRQLDRYDHVVRMPQQAVWTAFDQGRAGSTITRVVQRGPRVASTQ